MSNRNQAYQVIQRLRREGFEALLAGGCVRDRLLGRTASDYDVVTDAVPEQVIALFARTLKVGAQFGVVMVLLGGRQVEVATFRTEGGYQDGRRPGHVAFASAKEDAARRDFTVNGMFYDPLDKKLYDFVGGQADLQAATIRTIGNPDERFSEDYLRLLRAVRFAVKLDFAIEPKTWRSIQAHADRIVHISAERIAAELEDILTHPRRCHGVELLAAAGLSNAIFPELQRTAVQTALSVLGALPPAVDFATAMAALCAGLSTTDASALCRRLKLSNASIKHICFLLDHRGLPHGDAMALSDLKLLMAEPYFADVLTFNQALLKAGGKSLRPLAALKKRAASLDPTSIRPKPVLDGHTLIALGATPGPQVGRLARELYIAQLEEHLRTPQQARQWVVDWLKAHRATDS